MSQTLIFRSPIAREMDRLMADLFATPVAACGPCGDDFAPAANVWSDAQQYVIELDVPGFKMDQIEVSALGRELTLKGARPLNLPEGASLHLGERRGQSFQRVMRLPADARVEEIKAALKDGVLTVSVPKVEPVQPRKIVVQPTQN